MHAVYIYTHIHTHIYMHINTVTYYSQLRHPIHHKGSHTLQPWPTYMYSFGMHTPFIIRNILQMSVRS